MAVLLLCVPAAQATTYHWWGDGDGTSWNNPDNWDIGVPSGAASDLYDFILQTDTGPPSTVNLNGGNPQGKNWNLANFTINGPGHIDTGSSLGADVSFSFPGYSSGPAIINAAIQGYNGVQFGWYNPGGYNTGGTVILSSGANTYNGATTIYSGVVTAQTANDLGNPAGGWGGVWVLPGATLGVATSGWSSTQINSLLSNALWETGSLLGLTTDAGNLTYSNNITSPGINKSGGNTLFLTGTVTGTPLTCSGGTISISNTVTNSVLTNNATMNISGSVVGGTINAGGTTNLTGTISSAAKLNVTGTTYLSPASGSNSYTGGTTINSPGVLVPASPDALPGYNVAGKVSVTNNGTVLFAVGGASPWNASNIRAMLDAGAFQVLVQHRLRHHGRPVHS